MTPASILAAVALIPSLLMAGAPATGQGTAAAQGAALAQRRALAQGRAPVATTAPVAAPVAASVPASVPATTAATPSPVERWVWPLAPRPVVVRGFALGPMPWSPGHRGVDLAAPAGARVLAPADGVVSFTGVVAGRPVLSIDHGGAVSSFEPVTTPLKRGSPIRRGEVVGRLAVSAGGTHCAPRTCLHWGVRLHGRYVDPLLMLGLRLGPPVLLPLGHP
jgi:murein DD-endopeptidase MepM/ murein hydrolase activator NlpD